MNGRESLGRFPTQTQVRKKTTCSTDSGIQRGRNAKQACYYFFLFLVLFQLVASDSLDTRLLRNGDSCMEQYLSPHREPNWALLSSVGAACHSGLLEILANSYTVQPVPVNRLKQIANDVRVAPLSPLSHSIPR